MSKVFCASNGRFIYKTSELYKGRRFTVIGTSVRGKTEARRAWQTNKDRRIAEIDRRSAVKNGDIRLSRAMPEWYETFKRHDGRTARTIGTDLDTIHQIISEDLGGMMVNEITAMDIQKYLNGLKTRGLSPSTIKKRKNMLSMYFRDFDPVINPAKTVKTPKKAKVVGETKKAALTDEEMTKLANELAIPYSPQNMHRKSREPRGYLNGGILTVIMWEFLRVSEAAELRAGDIDLKAGVIHVRRQYDEKNKLVCVPKYDSVRDIPISGNCLEIIREAVKDKGENDLLFTAGKLNKKQLKHGGHIMEKALRETLEQACLHTGIERQVPHDLRHDGISYLVRRGARPTSIQKWAGHKSLTETLNTYYRQFEKDDPEDLAIMPQKV